jgi:hypothetical protein
MDQLEDLLIRLGSERFHGYGLLPIPDALDEEVRRLMACIREAETADRQVLFSLLTEMHGYVLLAFGNRRAALAVRSQNPQYAREALEAVSYGGRSSVDTMEAFLVVPLIYRSLTKLKVDPSGIFAGVRASDDARIDSFIRAFPTQGERDRSIEVMGWFESQDRDGLRYDRRDHPHFPTPK